MTPDDRRCPVCHAHVPFADESQVPSADCPDCGAPIGKGADVTDLHITARPPSASGGALRPAPGAQRLAGITRFAQSFGCLVLLGLLASVSILGCGFSFGESSTRGMRGFSRILTEKLRQDNRTRQWIGRLGSVSMLVAVLAAPCFLVMLRARLHRGHRDDYIGLISYLVVLGGIYMFTCAYLAGADIGEMLDEYWPFYQSW